MPTVGVGAEVLERWSAAFELPPSGHDHYTDDDDSKHEERINALAAPGITHGCGPLVFCPSGAVTRGQMAAFLHRALSR